MLKCLFCDQSFEGKPELQKHFEDTHIKEMVGALEAWGVVGKAFVAKARNTVTSHIVVDRTPDGVNIFLGKRKTDA